MRTKRMSIIIMIVMIVSALSFAIDCPLPTETPQPNISSVCIPDFNFRCIGSSRFIGVTVIKINTSGEIEEQYVDDIPYAAWQSYLGTIVPNGWTFLQALKVFVRGVLVDRGILPSEITTGDINFTCENCG